MIFKIKNDWQRVAKFFWIYLVPEHVLQESFEEKTCEIEFCSRSKPKYQGTLTSIGFWEGCEGKLSHS